MSRPSSIPAWLVALLATTLCCAGEPAPQGRFLYPLLLDESGSMTQLYCNATGKPALIHLFTLHRAKGRIWARPDVDTATVRLADEDYIMNLAIDDAEDVRLTPAETSAGISRSLTLAPRGFLTVRFPVWELEIWPQLAKRIDARLGFLLNTYGGVWSPGADPRGIPPYVLVPGSTHPDSPGLVLDVARFRAMLRLEQAAKAARPPAAHGLRSSVVLDRASGLVRITIECLGPNPVVVNQSVLAHLGDLVAARPAKAATAEGDLRAEPRVASPDDPAGKLLLAPGEGVGVDIALGDLAVWPVLEPALRKQGSFVLVLPAIPALDRSLAGPQVPVLAIPDREALDAATVREVILRQREQAASLH